MTRAEIILDGESLTLSHIEPLAAGATVSLDFSVKKKIEASSALVQRLGAGNIPVYGVNTGFGYFANKPIAFKQLEKLQHNLVVSHAAGWGDPLPLEEARLMQVLRLNVFAKGLTGIRYSLCQRLLQHIQEDLIPWIPQYGSVGASGDLVPLAHLALPLIGLGCVYFENTWQETAHALDKIGLKPFKLKAKEGLGLVNGTQAMLAIGSLALVRALKLIQQADQIAALTYEALDAHISPLDPLLHTSRGHKGQKDSAAAIMAELIGSSLFHPSRPHPRIQDPYSLRCAPQVHGASRDALLYACSVAQIELNAATDNPLVFSKEGKIISGGNFHGQPLAIAFDVAAIALSEIGNISERRLEALLNPHISRLPAFLSPNEGIESGYMALQYLSASLVNANKLLANPSSTDSIPSNVGIEDHVSMGMTAARKLRSIVSNIKGTLAAELLAATQALDCRKIKPQGKGTKITYETLRNLLPPLTADRIIASDMLAAVHAIETLPPPCLEALP